MANQGWRFLGDSAPVREILASVTRLLPTLGPGRRVPPILLQGETGTGKGLLARTIHETGPRAAGPFVDLNCAAIPATLIEAELFGFERGAFTDARQARTGLVEAAHRGTLFLDEIGLVPEGLQAKLLTVLETREVRPLGSTRARAVDVSIIAATNSDLREAVSQRRFREDLYHRLAVLVFSLPPLRERGDDVLELAETFLGRACADHALTKKLGDDARAAIAAYRWPGNVRELANLMERVALLSEGSIITAADLALPAVSIASTPTDRELPDVLSLKASVDTFTRARVEQALNEARGNISAAADRLGVPRSTLRYQLERFGLTQGGMGRARRRTAPVTPALSERVLVHARTVEGERRQVTVLFADFTEAMDRMAGGDPETTRQRFDPVLETMIDEIRRHEGSVNHVRHDGLMALFGAPVAQEDHAVRACDAAVSMHEGVGRLAEGMRSRLGADIKIRIGVHSGDVALRVIGNEVRIDYAAIPETTRVAARTVQAARPGTSLITAETLRLAEGFIEVAPAAQANVYELKAASVVRSRLRAAIARSLSQFVGRDAEIAQICSAMDRARSGRGQVVALVGEPGVGKSRLVYELTHSHRTQDWLVLEAGALSYGRATTYLPVIELLKGYFKITERETHREIREKVTGKLLSLDRALEGYLAALFWLLDVPVDDAAWEHLEPPLRRQQLLEGLCRLLLRESQVQPLVLVFEDLHWIDAETQTLLDLLVERLPTARLLLLVNCRPEYNHGWGRKTYYCQLRIDPLSSTSAEQLLGALLGDDPSVVALRPALIARTEGNPFFLEESVRGLVETGALSGECGAYRLVKAAETLSIPATVQAILAARIDRLAPDDKRLLQTASVIGKEVPVQLLQTIAEMDEPTVRAGLARLQAAEFLYEILLFPETEYTFKHALTHEVAYGTLLRDRQRTLHARLVDAIEQVYHGRLDEQMERLAQHAQRGEVWGKAVTYAQQAGARAVAGSAYPAAAKLFEAALAAMSHLPQDRETQERSVDLLLALCSIYTALGEPDRSLDAAQRARAEALGDEERLMNTTARLVFARYQTGDAAGAAALGEQVLALVDAERPGAEQVPIRSVLGQAYIALGDCRRAIALLERNREALRDWMPDPKALASKGLQYQVMILISEAWLALGLACVGSFSQAMAVAQEGAHLVQTFGTGAVHERLFVLFGLTMPACLRGDYETAIPSLEQGLALAREMNFLAWLPALAGCLGQAYAHTGRLAEGLALLEEATIQGETKNRVSRAFYLALQSEAALLAGQVGDARSAALRGLEGAHARRERGDEAACLRALGEAEASGDPPDIGAAGTHLQDALALASELGMRPLVAHCHLALGKLYRRTGKHEQAREHLTTATTMYREMGMTYWLEKAEAETRALS
jgi:DNA-binding NtrC family response regulator/tetratricopeptide (TPR) repeat protein